MPSASSLISTISLLALFAIGVAEIPQLPTPGMTLLCVVGLGVFARFSPDEEARLSRWLVLSFASGLRLMTAISSGGSALGRAVSDAPVSAIQLVPLLETFFLALVSLHALFEYAMVQATLDERDREQLFSRLNGFFQSYGSLRRADQEATDPFAAFSGRAYKAGV